MEVSVNANAMILVAPLLVSLVLNCATVDNDNDVINLTVNIITGLSIASTVLVFAILIMEGF